MSSIASLPTLTIPSAIVLGLAILLILLTAQIAQRDNRSRRSEPNLSRRELVPVENPRYKPPNPVRRLFALVTSSAIGVLLGALIAILLAYAAAYIVITLNRLLGG